MLLTCMMILTLNGPTDCVKYATPVNPAVYTIQRHDTLLDLSREFLGTPDRTELAHANRMGTGHGLHAGAILRVPVHTMKEFLLVQKRQNANYRAPVQRIGTANTVRAIRPGAWSSSGIYSCRSLESLWISAGGNPSRAFMAAEIAKAESGGNPNALSPTADYGLWQINRWAWGTMATYDPYRNAVAAIRISANGSNWNPWTTYRTGAYYGRC